MELYLLAVVMFIGLLIIVWQFGKHVGQSENVEKVVDNVKVAKEVETHADQLSVDAMRDSLCDPDK